MKEFIINKTNENQRLDKYLKRIMPSASNAFLYKMLRKKNIELNSKRALGKEILKNGDSIKVFLSDETFLKMSQTDKTVADDDYLEVYKTVKGVEVIFEHSDFLIVYKPEGLLSQKVDKNGYSLNEWCIGYLLSSHFINEESLNEFKPSVLNRLDRNTRGLVICSKTLKGSQRLSSMIAKREIKKYYITSVKGDCNLSGVYKAYLSKDEKKNVSHIYDNVEDIPKDAKYTPITTGIEKISYKEGVSELEIDLITGKSHQIRAHLSHLGFPIVGDTKYDKNAKESERKYQDLKAYKIVFPKFNEDDDWYSLSEKIIKC